MSKARPRTSSAPPITFSAKWAAFVVSMNKNSIVRRVRADMRRVKADVAQLQQDLKSAESDVQENAKQRPIPDVPVKDSLNAEEWRIVELLDRMNAAVTEGDAAKAVVLSSEFFPLIAAYPKMLMEWNRVSGIRQATEERHTEWLRRVHDEERQYEAKRKPSDAELAREVAEKIDREVAEQKARGVEEQKIEQKKYQASPRTIERVIREARKANGLE